MSLTASGLDRALACPGSVALPQRPHVGEATQWGSVVAAYRDAVVKVGRDAALAAVEDDDDRSKCAAIDLSTIPPGCESEVAIAYDPDEDKAERLSLTGHRAYPDDGRIYGTADRVGMHADGALYLDDDKSGVMKVRAKDAMQPRFLSLAFCRFTGATSARGAMLYLRHDGTWYQDRFEFDEFDLDAIRDQLLEIRAAARKAVKVYAGGGIPQLVPGPYCDHCAAAPECPAQERQRNQLAILPAGSLVEYLQALPLDRAGALVEQAITVGKLAEKAREAGNALAETLPDGLPLPSGRVLKRVQWTATVQSETAKSEIADKRAELRERGEITSEKTWQIRVVGKAKK